MKSFDIRVQSLIYQVVKLSQAASFSEENTEKKIIGNYLAAVIQNLPENSQEREHMLKAMESAVNSIQIKR